MQNFAKKLKGLDFVFKAARQTEVEDWHYMVLNEEIEFTMIKDASGKWRILSFTPLFIRDLENELGEAIEDFNRK